MSNTQRRVVAALVVLAAAGWFVAQQYERSRCEGRWRDDVLPEWRDLMADADRADEYDLAGSIRLTIETETRLGVRDRAAISRAADHFLDLTENDEVVAPQFQRRLRTARANAQELARDCR